MARRAAALAFSVALGGCHPVSAARLHARHIASMPSTTPTCPAEVTLAGKAQCEDVQTQEFAPMECCQAILDCHRDLADLQIAYVEPLGLLLPACALSPADLAALAQGDAESFNKSKACEPGCRDAAAALPPMPDPQAFGERCSKRGMHGDERVLEGVAAQAKMVSIVLDAMATCPAKQTHLAARPPRSLAVQMPCRKITDAKCPTGYVETDKQTCLRFRKNMLPYAHLREREYRVKCEKIFP